MGVQYAIQKGDEIVNRCPHFAFPPLDLQIDRHQYLARSAEHVSHVPGVRLI
jgi:hypothetical protein